MQSPIEFGEGERQRHCEKYFLYRRKWAGQGLTRRKETERERERGKEKEKERGRDREFIVLESWNLPTRRLQR